MPAVTMVAAWIRAEIGVGPSIESGSHTCRGTCADLPMAPTNRHRQISVATDHSWPSNTGTVSPAMVGALANTVAYPTVPHPYSPAAMQTSGDRRWGEEGV